MQPFDVIVVILIPLSAIGGYRTGAVSQIFGLGGLLIVVTIAWVVAPLVVRIVPQGASRAVTDIIVVVASLVGGYIFGAWAAKRAKSRVATPRANRVDAVTGSLISVACLLLATWFIAVNLAAGPFVSISESLRDSDSIRFLKDEIIAPPPLMTVLQTAASRFGYPDLLVGIPPVPGPPVRPPSAAEIAEAGQTGLRSSIEVLGVGCIPDLFNEGSGFVVAPGFVVTSAHVVAGTHDQFLYDDARRYPARLVAMDPELDVALLHAPTYRTQPLSLAEQEVERGSVGAVAGFPGGFHPRTSGAAVRGVIDVLAHSIYGIGVVHRRLYELQAAVDPGESGGPFVLPDGGAAGMLAYSSVLDPLVSYAIPSTVLAPIIQEGLSQSGTVSSGSCTLGH